MNLPVGSTSVTRHDVPNLAGKISHWFSLCSKNINWWNKKSISSSTLLIGLPQASWSKQSTDTHTLVWTLTLTRGWECFLCLVCVGKSSRVIALSRQEKGRVNVLRSFEERPELSVSRLLASQGQETVTGKPLAYILISCINKWINLEKYAANITICCCRSWTARANKLQQWWGKSDI